MPVVAAVVPGGAFAISAFSSCLDSGEEKLCGIGVNASAYCTEPLATTKLGSRVFAKSTMRACGTAAPTLVKVAVTAACGSGVPSLLVSTRMLGCCSPPLP